MNLKQWKKFIVCSDIHGDQMDVSSVRKFLEFNKQFKADIRILAGDLFDFRGMRGKASEEEKAESMQEDFNAGLKFLDDFRPHHFLKGNHDVRLDRLTINKNGMIRDAAQQGLEVINSRCKNYKTKIYPYDRRHGILRIGHLKVLHGFYSGLTAAKQHAQVYGSCLFGHVHDIQEHCIPRLERTVARSIGCLANLEMEYAAATPSSLRHAHGFAFGVVNEKTGDYFTVQAEEINGTWFTPNL